MDAYSVGAQIATGSLAPPGTLQDCAANVSEVGDVWNVDPVLMVATRLG